MRAYRVEKRVTANGALQLEALPFSEGELVEVIVLSREGEQAPRRSSVRGQVIEYIDPTEPVALDDWEALG